MALINTFKFQTSVKIIFTFGVVGVVVAGVFFLYYPSQHMQLPIAQSSLREITLGTTTLSVEVADTPLLRERGLSGRASLLPLRGMLFEFEEDGVWGIWMKDMRFSIDIIWMDAHGTVKTVAHNAQPESYPKVFYPSAPTRYVLEVPAGFARTHNIVKGDTLVLQ